MVDVSSLNVNQLKAVNWEEGPLLVLAGPGSGKTRVLAYRIARLMEESAGKSFRILGLTFTNKAAKEMRERVRGLVPNADERVHLTTFHTFSATILHQHGHHLGIRPGFAILPQEADRMAVLNNAMSRAGIEHPVDHTDKRLLSLVTRMTKNNTPVDTDVEPPQGDSRYSAQQIRNVYTHYRQLMIENNELDFDALIAEALRLLSKPGKANLIRRIYPYICVDEFQDTTLAQYDILCKIVNLSTKNLFVVADDNQTIYEWQGASLMRLKSLREDFDTKVLELPANYRCPPGVVGMANTLIAHNSHHHKVDSVSGKSDSPDHTIRVRAFDTTEEEVDWVAKDIAERHTGSKDVYAVLARTHKALEQVAAALSKHGLCVHSPASKNEFANERMVWLHSILRLANSRQSGIQLHRVCRSFCALEGVNLDMSDVLSEAVIMKGDYLSAWARVALQRNLDSTTRMFLQTSMPKLTDKLDVQDFVQDCFEWFEQRQEVNSDPDYETDYKEERDVWDALVHEAVGNIGREQVTLSALLQHIDLHPKEPPIPAGAIRCYTIHASKGMEFHHVYLIRLAEGELPSWQAVKEGDASSKMQEERRVCFVAITRTQKSLTLTYPLSISDYEKKPSRFLSEIGIGQS